MNDAPDRVAITGACGYLGVELARRCAARGIDVLGIDIRRPPGRWPRRARFLRQDVTGARLRRSIEEFAPRVLVHLAWVFDPTHDTEMEGRVDVDGTHNVFEAAAAARVKRIVYPSSTTCYGLDARRTRPLLEDDPPTPNPNYPYGRFKAEVEAWLPQFRAAHADVEVVVARACIVLGPQARNVVTHLTRWPVMFRVAGHDPPMQFLHQDDAVDLLWWMMTEAPAETFNAAGSGVVSYREICRMAGKPCVALPAPILYGAVGLGWRLRLLRFPAGLIDYVRYPWVADTQRMHELGFTPRHDSRDALAAYLRAAPEDR